MPSAKPIGIWSLSHDLFQRDAESVEELAGRASRVSAETMAYEDVIKRARRRPLFSPGATTAEVSIGCAGIQQMLPHRSPMLFVDRISAVDLDQRMLRAHRHIDPGDPLFAGHFPEQPVYPGALLVETIGQASLCLHHLLDSGRVEPDPADTPRPLRLLKVHHALFVNEVRPDDNLTLYSHRLTEDSYTVVCVGQVLRNDTICAMAVMEVYLVEGQD